MMRRWLTALVVAGLAGAGVAAAAPAVSASTTCQVINKSTHVSYGDLQQAIDDAASGATLFVSGTCTGIFQIHTSLTLTGQQPAGYPAPTLNGGGNGQTVLAITGGTVRINSLTITNGNSGQTSATGGSGGGIFNNGGNLRLDDSTVTGNTAFFGGGGIANLGGTLTLNDSSVTDNSCFVEGGGIFNGGTLTLNDSSVTSNTCGSGGGIFNGGTLTLNDSIVSGNTPDNIVG